MRWFTVIFFTAVLSFAAAQELPLAEPCDPENCQLPNCRCSSTEIPGGLAARDTPQFVLITFDDAVNTINIETYRQYLYGRVNHNQCPIGTTFYVNHEYTDYRLVNELYNNGFEIALHSISHQSSQEYWREGSYEDMWMEFADQRTQMSHFANIPASELRGIRKPFLEMGGNATMKVIADAGLLYDCSWPAINTYDPGLWPYTLDYASTQECPIAPCPTASVPGVWVLPMIPFVAPNGFPCSMVDACTSFPDRNDEEAWYQFILSNFERQYLGNRAPFGFFVHEWYVRTYPGVLGGLTRFMDTIQQLSDVFVVNSHEVIDWVRNPVPVNEYRTRPCRTHQRTVCSMFDCRPLEHNDQLYYMQHCNVCPASYPWLGNPLGY